MSVFLAYLSISAFSSASFSTSTDISILWVSKCTPRYTIWRLGGDALVLKFLPLFLKHQQTMPSSCNLGRHCLCFTSKHCQSYTRTSHSGRRCHTNMRATLAVTVVAPVEAESTAPKETSEAAAPFKDRSTVGKTFSMHCWLQIPSSMKPWLPIRSVIQIILVECSTRSSTGQTKRVVLAQAGGWVSNMARHVYLSKPILFSLILAKQDLPMSGTDVEPWPSTKWGL